MKRLVALGSFAAALALSVLLMLSAAGAQDEPLAFDTELGAATYASCMGCHGNEGQGTPGVFPPLAQHLPNVVAKEGGRTYLINAVLFGLEGEVTILGNTFNAMMPAWGGSLDDAQIAAVLDHVLTSWGNDALLPEEFTAITAEEVAAERENAKAPADVLALREALELDGTE